jgi:ABC-type Fe3+-hydroxamate transport system substrate-binding protein
MNRPNVKDWKTADLKNKSLEDIVVILNYYSGKIKRDRRDSRLETLFSKSQVYAVFSDWGSYDYQYRTLEKVFSSEDDAKKYIVEFEQHINSITALIPKDPKKEESFWNQGLSDDEYIALMDEYNSLVNKIEEDYYKSLGKQIFIDDDVIDFNTAQSFNMCIIEKKQLE